jgi:hypothetical protein
MSERDQGAEPFPEMPQYIRAGVEAAASIEALRMTAEGTAEGDPMRDLAYAALNAVAAVDRAHRLALEHVERGHLRVMAALKERGEQLEELLALDLPRFADIVTRRKLHLPGGRIGRDEAHPRDQEVSDG